MTELPPTLTQDAIIWALVMARLSGLMLTAPLLQLTHIPMMWKALVVGVFSLAVMPTLPPSSGACDWQALPSFAIALHLVVELAVGGLLGALLGISLSIALTAGTLMDSLLGFSNATLLDPATHESHPLVASLYQALMAIVILGLDGHQALFLLIARSFQWMPVGQISHGAETVQLAQSLAGLFFPMVLSLCLPLLMSLLGIEILLAFMSKLMPQVNIMMAGASLKLGLGWLMVWWSLPSTIGAMDKMFWSLLGRVGGG
jgi:flagellar biosynthetic protein FliR